MGAKMSNDTKWVIGTVVVLGGIIGGLLSAQIQGVSTSLNIRINDLNSSLSMRINDLNTSVSGRIDRFREPVGEPVGEPIRRHRRTTPQRRGHARESRAETGDDRAGRAARKRAAERVNQKNGSGRAQAGTPRAANAHYQGVSKFPTSQPEKPAASSHRGRKRPRNRRHPRPSERSGHASCSTAIRR